LTVNAAIAIPSPLLQTILRGVNPCEELEDPLPIEPGAINITANPFLVIDFGSEQFGAVATGLSGLVTEHSYNAILQQISFKVALPYAHIVGDRYFATGSIDATPFRSVTFPSGPFSGDGKFEASVNDFFIEGKLNILFNLMTNKVEVRNVTNVELTFSKFFAELGGFVINGAPHDFDEWNANFKANFDTDFPPCRPCGPCDVCVPCNPSIKNGILEKVTVLAKELFGQLTVGEFIEIITKPAPTCPPRHE